MSIEETLNTKNSRNIEHKSMNYMQLVFQYWYLYKYKFTHVFFNIDTTFDLVH